MGLAVKIDRKAESRAKRLTASECGIITYAIRNNRTYHAYAFLFTSICKH